MKTKLNLLNAKNYLVITAFCIITLGQFSCSKTKDAIPKTVLPEFTVNLIKINTAARIPALNSSGSFSSMCYSSTGNKIYVYSYDHVLSKPNFTSYNLAHNTWETLTVGAINFGRIVYGAGDKINTFAGQQQIYDIATDKWTSHSIPSDFGLLIGSIGISIAGKGGFFTMGTNAANTETSLFFCEGTSWSKKAALDTKKWNNANSSAVFYNNKIYAVAGIKDEKGGQGYIYDTETSTVEKFSIPQFMGDLNTFSSMNHVLAVHQGLIFFLRSNNKLGIFNPVTKKWYGQEITIIGFEGKGANLFVNKADVLYIAGSNDGEFVLYKLDITAPDEAW